MFSHWRHTFPNIWSPGTIIPGAALFLEKESLQLFLAQKDMRLREDDHQTTGMNFVFFFGLTFRLYHLLFLLKRPPNLPETGRKSASL